MISPSERPRPRFHFTPPAAWLNDPNGLIYLDGEYHLFYQHHPHSLSWGAMYWGHAVSADLVHWEHLPIALEPDDEGQIFSGSAVLDRAGSAGFGPNALVAIFTHYRPGRQVQSLAYSLDRGRTWAKYAANPVLLPPEATPDFRDPRVFWYDAGAGAGHWVMLLAAGRRLLIYTSPDLRAWTNTDELPMAADSADHLWECPDLQRLSADNGRESRWALIVSVMRGAPAGGCGTRYQVGDFDGARFAPVGPLRWADYGADFYAAQAWNDPPEQRPRWLAWMSNWVYAHDLPALAWRGSMSAPREIELSYNGADLLLVQRPARELTALRGPAHTWRDLTIAPGATTLPGPSGLSLEILATFRADSSAQRFGLRIGDAAHPAAVVSYHPARQELTVERGPADLPPSFTAPQRVALVPRNGLIALQLLLDHGSLEIFADEGRLVLTNQLISGTNDALQLFADGAPATLSELIVYELK